LGEANKGEAMKFADIPQFPRAYYAVYASWYYLEEQLAHYFEKMGGVCALNLEPDYQRGHVWTDEQRIAFVEYGLMGGEAAMDIIFNCPGWMRDYRGPSELVDGLQRITAVRKFMHNEIPAFGCFKKNFEDKMSSMEPRFRFRVLTLGTREETLKLYLLLNSGGVVHSKEEISRVKELLANEVTKG
jgi:hypothetical protein